ncbi:uncharacterized protein LOC135936526 [Cloeon dipterum]|uniref:uncharacterized protein LOC135936526 n=1 Tax=Cloeon dipterum TaxID=197152 RepID=UPI00321FB36E
MACKGALLLALALTLVSGQELGFDCDPERPCLALNELCDDGFCKCLPGFIRNEKHCFPARSYGESCFFDMQCAMFPMVCSEQKSGFGKRCQCHKFFRWDAEVRECRHKENLAAMVSKLEQKFDFESKIDNQANSLFPGMVAAGVMVLVVGFIMAAACAVYVCYSGSWKPCCRRERQEFECHASEFERLEVKSEGKAKEDV